MQNKDKIMRRFKNAVGRIYGDRLERVVLFGSRARGDALPDSDYDVAIFLKDMPDRWAEVERLVPLRLEFLERDGAEITVLPFAEADYAKRTGLMHAIRTEGVPL